MKKSLHKISSSELVVRLDIDSYRKYGVFVFEDAENGHVDVSIGDGVITFTGKEKDG